MEFNKLYFIIILFLPLLACNDDTFLEVPPSEIVKCQNFFDELSHIRIDKIGKSRYKYDMIDGTEHLVQIVDSASYNTIFFDYQNGHLSTRKGFDRLEETVNSEQEFSYNNGQINRINYYISKDDESAEIREFGLFSILSRNELGQVIERKSFIIRDGQEELERSTNFEWDDCNLIKIQSFDKNKTLGYTTTFYYDDKVNPYGLPKVAKTLAWVSTNNVLISETIETNDPNYLFGPLLNSGISEYSFTYNEFGLPTRKRFNEFDKVDFYYTID